MNDTHFILEGKEPKPVDLMTWAKWYETANRTVARDIVNDYLVSTVFLGLDHRFDDGGPPLLFETMVFPRCGKTVNYMLEEFAERASTWDEAEACHRRGIEFVRKRLIN